jgi:squalene-hopene/tetraprenyl-beta-curcumene cyclase
MSDGMRRAGLALFALAVLVLAGFCAVVSRPATRADDAWNRKAAAAYLDKHENAWMAWPKAAREQGTFCVSCHTAMPYALARPALDSATGEKQLTPDERKLADDVTKRVRLWKDIKPYYGGGEASPSRGTEAVLNALVLANYDARNGKLSEDTREAFEEMWSLQKTSGPQSGAWEWISFNNEPWEAPDSAYYGASLAAVAVGLAPENYGSTPEIQQNLTLLRGYLIREAASQTPLNRVMLLWAATESPGTLDQKQREAIVKEIISRQQADGGWCLSTLVGNWKRSDSTPLVMKSDGVATGLIAYVLQRAGIAPTDPHLKNGLSWLVRNQTWWGGHWEGYSLNARHHNLLSPIADFMDDAATAFAVLALTQSEAKAGATASGAGNAHLSAHPETQPTASPSGVD